MASFFGGLILSRRQDLGLSAAEAARLAGIEESEWLAVEQGTVPTDKDRLHAMADALEMGWNGMMMFMMICRQAWEE
ncbi:MAG TPA: helix-turn-helix transcriptional regulator [Terracidiphilus sp.]|nr:helix-turn-helix transcriptional regulator [Terracidiphilus sp.]